MSNNANKEFEKKMRPLAEALRDYAMTEGAQYGITDFKIGIVSQQSQTNAVEKCAVTSVVSGSKCQVAVTLYAGDRVMSLSKNTLDEEELRAAILANMKLIHLAPENDSLRLLEREKVYKGKAKDLDTFDTNPPTQEQMIDYVKAVEAAVMAEKENGVKATRAVNIAKSVSHVFVLATNGLVRSESGTSYYTGAHVVAEDASGMQIDGEGSGATHFADLDDPAKMGKTAALNAIARLSAIQPNTGPMPIVLDREAAEDFFGILYEAIDGTEIHRGSSYLKGQLGKKVVSPEITLVDEPSIPRSRRSGTIDSAGLKMKKVTFIRNGVLKAFNANLREARLLGIEPMGRENGYTNSTIMPGSKTPDQLMADIKEGIYIKGFSGGTVDVNDGTHSREAHGVLIKDGKITNIAVDGFVVSGNLKDMFKNVSLANDTPRHPSNKHSIAAPTTRINGVTIAGK